MGKSSKTETPPAPDYTAAAQQQGQQNQLSWMQQNQANRPTQVNNQGVSEWSQDANGNWTQSQFLNPQQAGIYDSQQNNQQGIANAIGNNLNNFDTSQIALNTNGAGVAGMPNVVNYESLGNIPQVGQYSQQATDLTNRLMQPQLDATNDAARARAAAMGLGAGSGAGNNFMEYQNSQRSNDAALKAALAGINQGNIMFGQGMQAYGQGAQNLTNQFNQGMGIHSQGMQDVLQNNQATLNQRAGNLGQLSGLMGLTQQSSGVPQFGSFGQAGAYQGANLMDAQKQAYDAQLNTTNAANSDAANKAQSQQQTLATAATVAAAVF